MDNKIVALIIVVLLIVVGAAYVIGTQNSNTPAVAVNNSSNTTNDVNHQKTNEKTNNTNNTNNTPNVKITAQEAIKLVEQNGQAAGEPSTVKATNPTLIKVSGVYYWKVTYDGGPMYVNANTGEVIALL